jgi:N utilization substance protein B
MLFAADVVETPVDDLIRDFWNEVSDSDADEDTREFANNLVLGTRREIEKIDGIITSRAEHWRIPRMAIVDRNVLRLAVFEFICETTPNTVVINEALEIARRFSTFEATQFINGILDAIKQDLSGSDEGEPPEEIKKEKRRTKTSSI